MKILKKKLILFSLFLGLVTIFIFGTQQIKKENFVISTEINTKKFSKNKLKEKIGQQMKDALHDCAELTKKLGQIQIKLSGVQKQLFEKIEELLDNKRPFKKASRANLSDAYKIMHNVKEELGIQVERVKKLSLQMNKNSCLKKGI